MADPFVAEIRIFGFNFAPKGWAFCNGQLLPISQNTALFSLLGTMYGGDGKSTFALPDLQGRTPMFWGQGPGLSLYDQGQTGGEEYITLLQSEMPAHNHFIQAVNDIGDSNNPTGNSLARSAEAAVYSPAGPPPTLMAPLMLLPTGGNLPHNNMSPYNTLNMCIALQGVFPPRG